jgi:hypothetical protein
MHVLREGIAVKLRVKKLLHLLNIEQDFLIGSSVILASMLIVCMARAMGMI